MNQPNMRLYGKWQIVFCTVKWSKEQTNGLVRQQKEYTSWHSIWNCPKPTKTWNDSEVLRGVWRQDLTDLEGDNKQLLRTLFLLTFSVFLAPPVLEKLLNEITHNQNLIKVVALLTKFLQAMPWRIWNFLYQRISVNPN